MLSLLWTVLCIVVVLILIVVAVKVFLVLLPFLLIGAVIFFVVKCDSDDISFLKDGFEKVERNARNESIVYRVRSEEERISHRIARDITIAKAGVNMSSLRPEIDSAIVIIVEAFQDAMEDDSFLPVITSADDFSGHAKNSAHYAGAAIDLRIKDVGNLNVRKALAEDIRERLDDRFYVLHEDIGSSNEHLHVQMRKGTFDACERWR